MLGTRLPGVLAPVAGELEARFIHQVGAQNGCFRDHQVLRIAAAVIGEVVGKSGTLYPGGSERLPNPWLSAEFIRSSNRTVRVCLSLMA